MPNPPPPKPLEEETVALRSFQQLDVADQRSQRKHNNTQMHTTQGAVVIDDLDIPEDIKGLLFDMDFDTSGDVSTEELKNMCTCLTRLHEELGENANMSKVCELLDLVCRQVGRKKANASYMEYAHLPENIQKCFRIWDLDKSGSVDATELMAAADAWQRLQKESALMKKLLFAACIVIVLMFAGMFAMGMVTAELAKEFKAGGSGADPKMTSKSGDTIQVASTDSQVDEEGMLLTRRPVLSNSTTGRSLLGTDSASVATKVAKTKKKLVSTLPNSFFDALNEITVYSEKGHTLNLKIQGYARIPLKNSRCGNVLKMYTSVDGAIVLDSSELSFEDKLHDLFKNAGFEVAVGGAAGRRLAASAGVDGFFNHVSKMKSEGSWKCGDIPLPHMPKTHIKRFDDYTPCIDPDPASNTRLMNSCDSTYGGRIVGTTKLPAEHASATLSRLDKVQDTLINGKVKNPTADKLYTKTSEYSIVSPGYTVQQTTYEAHPAQTLIRVTDLTEKKTVSFQQMHADASEQAVRNFCKESTVADPVLKEKEAQKDTSKDTSMHFEYVGLEGEGSKTYRRFRMIPSKDFNAWMATEGVGKIPSSVYHYWDDADSDVFIPYRIVTPGGDVVVYTEMSQKATDEEAEAFLKNTVNATKFGVFTKPYKMQCDEAEKGSGSAEFGVVPEISSSELSSDDIDFYARYLYDASSASDGAAAASDDAQALTDATASGNDTSALLAPAYTFLETVASTSANYAFAQHAVLANSKLSMASICSAPCAADRKSVQDHMTQNGAGTMCAAPQLKPLVDCIDNLDSQIRAYCLQSKFWSTYNTECNAVAKSRRLQQGQAQMRQLADGTHSLDLGSLDQQTRMHLGQAISTSQKDESLADLKGYLVLYNASDKEKATPNALLSGWESDISADASGRSLVSRRLWGVKDCTERWKPGYCIEFTFPKPGNPYCARACSAASPMPPDRCEKNIVQHCKLSFKVKVTPPYFSYWNGYSGSWTIQVELGGSIAMLEVMFGIFCPPSPLYGDATMKGGIIFSTARSCPNIPFRIEGYASIGFAAGVKLWIISLNLFSISLKIGAKIVVVHAAGWWYRGDRRRGWDWRRRRRGWWGYHYRPYRCDVQVYVRIDVQVLIVKGWMLMQYFIFSKILKIQLGVQVHISLWLVSFCKNVWSQWVLNTRIR